MGFPRGLCRLLSALAVVGSVAGSLACTSFQPLDLSGGVPVVREGDGILLVHIVAGIALESLESTGGHVGRDLGKGDHLVILSARPGRYRWTRIHRNVPGYRRFFYRLDETDDQYVFDVEPGVVNYVGQWILGKWSRPRSLSVSGVRWRILNRAAMTLAELEQRHPQLVGAFPMRYSGPARDDFLERYMKAKRVESAEGRSN